MIAVTHFAAVYPALTHPPPRVPLSRGRGLFPHKLGPRPFGERCPYLSGRVRGHDSAYEVLRTSPEAIQRLESNKAGSEGEEPPFCPDPLRSCTSWVRSL